VVNTIQVLHDTPGRLRLAVPAIRGSRAEAVACEKAVWLLPGVSHVQANPLTGTLLVLYTPTPRTRETIEELWRTLPEFARMPEWLSCGHSAHGRRGHTGTVTVMTELVRHLLPVLLGSCPICRGR